MNPKPKASLIHVSTSGQLISQMEVQNFDPEIKVVSAKAPSPLAQVRPKPRFIGLVFCKPPALPDTHKPCIFYIEIHILLVISGSHERGVPVKITSVHPSRPDSEQITEPELLPSGG